MSLPSAFSRFMSNHAAYRVPLEAVVVLKVSKIDSSQALYSVQRKSGEVLDGISGPAGLVVGAETTLGFRDSGGGRYTSVVLDSGGRTGGTAPEVQKAEQQTRFIPDYTIPPHKVTGTPIWRKGPEGPVKFFHEAIWDSVGNRMLVFSGFPGRGLLSVPPINGTPGGLADLAGVGSIYPIGGVGHYFDVNYYAVRHTGSLNPLLSVTYAIPYPDAFFYDSWNSPIAYRSLSGNFNQYNLQTNNDLWQFRLVGGWVYLGSISYNAWVALKTPYAASSLGSYIGISPTTVAQGDSTVVSSSGVKFNFGGTFDGSALYSLGSSGGLTVSLAPKESHSTGASGQFWIYS